MKIALNTNEFSEFDSEFKLCIEGIPEMFLFNKEHGLNIPIVIYNKSTQKIITSFTKFFSEIEKEKRNNSEISEAHKEITDALMSYVDDIYHIMKCYIPKKEVSKNITFADKWVKALYKAEVECFKKEIEVYRKSFADINNRIKHNHGRYSYIEMNTKMGNVYGYCIDGVNEDGAIIPCLDIHPQFKGQYTGNSYNHDILRYFFAFHAITYYAKKLLYKIFKKRNSIIVDSLKKQNKENQNSKELYNKIAGMKKIYFPNEYDCLTEVKFCENQFEMAMPARKSYVQKLYVLNNAKFLYEFSADGYTNSWGIPYFGGSDLDKNK